VKVVTPLTSLKKLRTKTAKWNCPVWKSFKRRRADAFMG
jgi:hypothetical protein